MLTIEENRKILGEVGKDMTDSEIIELRNTCQSIIELSLDNYFEEKLESNIGDK